MDAKKMRKRMGGGREEGGKNMGRKGRGTAASFVAHCIGQRG